MSTLKTVLVTLLVVVVVALGAVIYANRGKIFGSEPTQAAVTATQGQTQEQTLPIESPLVEILSPSMASGAPYAEAVDWETGDVKWTKRGLGKGSLMIADGKLIIMSDKGQLVIAEASPGSYNELASAKVLSGLCWTVPVLSNGKIYCRSHPGLLVCVDVSK